MVNKVTNLNIKSFNDYTGPNEEFKRVNLVFGYNGRGKTSLAKGIVDVYMKQTGKEEGYRLYNKRFIRENILLEEGNTETIKGVIANFGKHDIEIENEIREKQSKIEDVETLRGEIDSLKQRIRKEIDEIHDRRKGSSGIQKKPSSKTIWEVISLYNADYENAMKLVAKEEKLRSAKGDDSFEKRLLGIESTSIPKLMIPSEKNVREIENIFNTSFDDIAIPNANVIEWMSDGIAIHKDSTNCLFCGGIVNLDSIEKRLEDYKENKKIQSTEAIRRFKGEIKQVKDSAEILWRLCGIYEEYSDADDKDISAELKVAIEALQIAINALEEKEKHIDTTVKINITEVIKALNDINEANNSLTTKREALILEYSKLSQRLGTVIKGAIALDVKESSVVQGDLNQLKQLEDKYNRQKQKNKELSAQIENLRNSKSSTKDFADQLSETFEAIGISLELGLQDDDYIIRHSSTGEQLSIDEISEGEQNLLALLYFYYELFQDKRQTRLKDEIELIVIDDPVSSVDDINRMYVLELINRICMQKIPQVFVLTHVWEDFCNLCYNKKDDDKSPYRIYEIKKGSNGSFVETTRSTETPYKHNFKDIYALSQIDNSSCLGEVELYHYPNIMRGILEEFLMFKSVNHNPTRSNIGTISHVLCGDSPNANDSIMIGVLLNVCNIMSHKSSRNPDEILESAKFLMKKIRQVDQDHFNAMIN